MHACLMSISLRSCMCVCERFFLNLNSEICCLILLKDMYICRVTGNVSGGLIMISLCYEKLTNSIENECLYTLHVLKGIFLATHRLILPSALGF